MRQLAMKAVLGGAAVALVLAGCGAGGLERAGWRVDDRDRVRDCVQNEQVLCFGSGYPDGVVDARRRRVVVVWEGSYAPNVDEVFARVLDASGEPMGEVAKLGEQKGDRPPHVALGAGGTYEVAWDGRVRTYSSQLQLLRERYGRLARTADPHMARGRYGSPLAQVPGGADVLLYRTMDWQIRAIPQARSAGRR